MRWSRHHTDTSLGELMEARPETADPEPGDEADEPTRVRLWPGDYTGEPTDTTPTTSSPPAGPGDGGPDAGDDFLDDADYLPQERRGPGRLTVALVAALVLAVGVFGGVWVEKQLGSGGRAVAGGGQGFPGGRTRGQGVPGGTTGGQGEPGGTTGGQGGAGVPGGDASAAPGGSSPDASGGDRSGSGGTAGTPTTPAVVGTVASATARSLVVTDLGGTKHTVEISGTTTLTVPYRHGSLKTGDTVAVAGTAGPDGSVTATGVTVS